MNRAPQHAGPAHPWPWSPYHRQGGSEAPHLARASAASLPLLCHHAKSPAHAAADVVAWALTLEKVTSLSCKPMSPTSVQVCNQVPARGRSPALEQTRLGGPCEFDFAANSAGEGWYIPQLQARTELAEGRLSKRDATPSPPASMLQMPYQQRRLCMQCGKRPAPSVRALPVRQPSAGRLSQKNRQLRL